MKDKVYQVHVEWVNVLGQTVNFSSELMSLADCLQVRESWPGSVVTEWDKGEFRHVQVQD